MEGRTQHWRSVLRLWRPVVPTENRCVLLPVGSHGTHDCCLVGQRSSLLSLTKQLIHRNADVMSKTPQVRHAFVSLHVSTGARLHTKGSAKPATLCVQFLCVQFNPDWNKSCTCCTSCQVFRLTGSRLRHSTEVAPLLSIERLQVDSSFWFNRRRSWQGSGVQGPDGSRGSWARRRWWVQPCSGACKAAVGCLQS